MIAAPRASAYAATSALVVSTETTRTPLSRSVKQRVLDAGDLLAGGDGRSAGACRLAADVDDIGPLREERIDPLLRRRRALVQPAIAERIGRGVEHPHQQNPSILPSEIEESFEGLTLDP